MLKKFISFLVLASMVFAVIPTVTATEQTELAGVVYVDFNPEATQEPYINEPIQITEPVSFDIEMEQPKIVKEVSDGDVSLFAVTADKTADWNAIMNNRFGDSYLAPYRKKSGQNVTGATNRLVITETDLSLPGKNGLDVNIRRKHDNQSADDVYSLYRAPGNTIYNYRYVRAFTDTATNATVYIGFYTEDDFHRYMGEGITISSYPTVTYHIKDRGIYCYYAEDIYSKKRTEGITLVPDNAIPRFYENMKYPESTFNDILNYSILTNRNYLPAEWELELPEASLYAYESSVTTLSKYKAYQYCSLGAFRDFDGTVHMLEGDQIVKKYEDKTAELSFSVRAENGFLDFSGFITERELDDTGIMYNTTITDRRTGYTYYMYNIGLSTERQLIHQRIFTVAVKDKFGNMIQYRYNGEYFSEIAQIVDTYGREINFEKFNSETGWGIRVSYEDENGEEKTITYEKQTLSPDALDNDSEIRGKPVEEFKVTNSENETTTYYSRATEFLTFDTVSQIQAMYNSMPHADGMPTGISYKSNIEKIVYPTGAETVYNYEYLYFSNKSMSTARGLYAVSESYDISDTDEIINHKTYTFENTSTLITKNETDITRGSATVSEYAINGHIKDEELRKERVYEKNVYRYNDDNQLIKLTNYNCATTTAKEYEYVYGYPDVLSSVITAEKDKTTYTYHKVDNKMTGIPETVSYYKYNPSTERYTLDYSVNTVLDSDNKDVEYERVIKDNIIKSQRKYVRDNCGRITAVIEWIGDTNGDGVLDENDEIITLNSTYALNENGSIGITDTVSGVINADGETTGEISTEYLYTVTGLPYSRKTPDGQVTEIEYDGIGRAVKYTYPNLSTEEITYDIINKTTVYTDRAGKKTKIEYDGLGKPIKKYFYDTVWKLTEEYSYDLSERLTEKKTYTDSEQYTKEVYEYDVLDRVKKRTVYDGLNLLYTEEYTYNHNYTSYTVNKTVSAADGTATATEVCTYNAFKNLMKKEYVSGTKSISQSYTYDYKDRLISETDGKGNRTAYEYDSNDNITLITYADGTNESFAYDMAGRKITSADRNGIETTNTYDVLGREIKTEINTAGTDTSLIKRYYDENSNLIKESIKTNERGDTSLEVFKTTENIYDNMNNLLGTKTGREAVRYWYDEAGRVSAMQTGITELNANAAIPQNGSVTRYTYNNLGYLISETDALNNSKSFTYDYAGRNLTSTDRNGAVTTNVYGPYGVISTSITDVINTEKYTYEYDSLGRLKTTKLYNNDVLKDTISSEYDVFGRKIEETTGGYTNVYEYDNNSLVTSYSLKEGTTVKQNINYVYNSMNRLTEQTIDDTMISYGYDFNGNLTEKVIGNLRTDISYNSFNEPVEYTNKSGGTILNSYEYTYNSAGNRLTETDTANNIHKVYEYDNADRLVKEAISGAVEKESTYIYDSNGNRMTEDTEYEQDLFSEENESFSYNQQNQLVQYTRGNTTVSYEYGANGLRKSKTVNGVTTGYVWNGANLAAETNGETITSIYSYGVDGITLKTTGETESYYLKNAHGDVTGIANAGGTMTAEYVYDSFGNILTNTTNDTNPFRYCGEYIDHESGMVYLRNRYYNPTLGRFITEDTYWNLDNMIYGDNKDFVKFDTVVRERTDCDSNIVFSQKSNYKFEKKITLYTNKIPDLKAISQSSNLYVYCLNNPISNIDPTGEVANGIGISAYAALGIRFDLQAFYVWDDDGNEGIILVGGGGGGTPNAGISGTTFINSSADTIFDLEGLSVGVGGGAGLVGGDINGDLSGGSLAVGFGVLPAELHGVVTLGKILTNW